MTLQNRVDPFGTIHAVDALGTMMGNRGGKLHDSDTKTLGKRRWVNKHWIICVTDFNNRKRDVMGQFYTELFFLDEVTALSAGHRPCFECRRKDAKAFQAAFQKATGLSDLPKVGVMDPILHLERLDGKGQRQHLVERDALIDGAMILVDGQPHAVKDGALLRWHFEGYVFSGHQVLDLGKSVSCLTPPTTLSVLANGYHPQWHKSADPENCQS